jgi:glycosyltransferase involved in cell wall biosynthesis
LKILYLHQYFNTLAMSGGTRSFEIARRFVALGDEVTVVTSARTATAPAYCETEEEGVRVKWIPVPYHNSFGVASRLFAFFKFALLAIAVGFRGKYDVVYATSTPLTVAIPGIVISKIRRIPMVFEVRDLWPDLPIAMGYIRSPLSKALSKWLERKAYENSSHIVALSPGMRDGILQKGIDADSVSVIPNSCDLTLFATRGDFEVKRRYLEAIGASASDKLVVYLGTLGRINGVCYLVDLAFEVRGRGICFVVYGDGAEFEMIRQHAESKGILGDNFFLFSSIPKSSVPSVLAIADAAFSLFLPIKAMEMNSANKFFDALAAGCPPAINYGGWQAELLRSRGAGVVLNQEIRESARILESFLDEEVVSRKASANARKLAREEFDRDVMASRVREQLRLAVERFR